MASDDPVVRIAPHQYGLATRAQLLGAGMTAKAIEVRLRRGQLERRHPGVYAVGGSPRTWHQDVLAACLFTGGVASHRSAARLWSFDVDDVIEVSADRARGHHPAGVIVHRPLDLAPRYVTRRQAIPCTNPLRLLVDLGAVVEPDVVEEVLVRAVVRRLCTIAAVKTVLEDHARRGRAGTGVLRGVLDEWALGDRQPDSVLEPYFAKLFRRYGVPMPTFQHELTLAGRRRRIDFAYPDRRIAIEIDGFETRARRDVFIDERARQNELEAIGWTVLRFTWHDLRRRPGYVAAMVTRVLGGAEAG